MVDSDPSQPSLLRTPPYLLPGSHCRHVYVRPRRRAPIHSLLLWATLHPGANKSESGDRRGGSEYDYVDGSDYSTLLRALVSHSNQRMNHREVLKDPEGGLTADPPLSAAFCREKTSIVGVGWIQGRSAKLRLREQSECHVDDRECRSRFSSVLSERGCVRGGEKYGGPESHLQLGKEDIDS